MEDSIQNLSIGDSEKKSSGSFELKTPKGTRDYGPSEMAIRESVLSSITRIFKLHGAVTIDTPVFELKDVLTGKYGEDSKLIYDLKDQGGELCSLRYDLTVPFARYLAMNKHVKTMKRYHIAKVYRRDQPALTRGRYREFIQCDLDIAGGFYEPMLPDAEIFKVVYEVLTEVLGSTDQFIIKCNNRMILDGMFELVGVPIEKFRAICSAVDKLDKTAWADVRKEMIEEKGLPAETADRIGEYVKMSGGVELVDSLLLDSSPLASNPSAKAGLEQMKALFTFLRIFGVADRVSFDLSLARGLDYYTGVILEAVALKGDVGSIAGGGRYDNLVGMFSKSNQQIPCVGVSFGVERIFTILEQRNSSQPGLFRASPVEVFVAAAGGEMIEERLTLCNQLWSAGIRAEYLPKRKVKPLDQFSHCEKNLIPFAIVLGPTEMAAGLCKIRNTAERTEETIHYDNVVAEIKSRLALC